MLRALESKGCVDEISFDSSAIFKAIKENRVDVLVGNCTLELARYELGNVLWKNFALEGKAKETEIKSLLE